MIQLPRRDLQRGCRMGTGRDTCGAPLLIGWKAELRRASSPLARLLL